MSCHKTGLVFLFCLKWKTKTATNPRAAWRLLTSRENHCNGSSNGSAAMGLALATTQDAPWMRQPLATSGGARINWVSLQQSPVRSEGAPPPLTAWLYKYQSLHASGSSWWNFLARLCAATWSSVTTSLSGPLAPGSSEWWQSGSKDCRKSRWAGATSPRQPRSRC